MARQEVGNLLSFPPLSLKHCFIRGRFLPLLPQASRESVCKPTGLGQQKGQVLTLCLREMPDTAPRQDGEAHREDHERVPDPPHRGLWVPAGPMATESAASRADSGINSAYAWLMQLIGSAGPGPSCCSELPNCPGSRGAALIYTINTLLLQTVTCVSTIFQAYTMKLYEGVPGLFIYLYPRAWDLQLFINTSWAICFLFLAGMLCAGNSCQPLGAVLLRAAVSDKERPLRIQPES